MKYFYPFFLIICLVSCKTKNHLAAVLAKEESSLTCPESFQCSVNVMKNSGIQINTDNLGSKYPKVVKGSGFVLKFEFKKSGNTKYQDSGYREEVFIELDKDNLEIETEMLTDKKLFFARWCYCKGETGYYKIKNGKLKITKVDTAHYNLRLQFLVDEVPQIINEINHTFNIH